MTDKSMATADQMALARGIAATCGPEMKAGYRGRRFQIALAAIIETTDAAIKTAADMGERYAEPTQRDYDRRDGCYDIAAALRTGDHLKGADHG